MEVEQCQAYIFIPLQEMKGSNESMEMDHKENVGSFRSETEVVQKYCMSLRVIAGGPKSKYFSALLCSWACVTPSSCLDSAYQQQHY